MAVPYSFQLPGIRNLFKPSSFYFAKEDIFAAEQDGRLSPLEKNILLIHCNYSPCISSELLPSTALRTKKEKAAFWGQVFTEKGSYSVAMWDIRVVYAAHHLIYGRKSWSVHVRELREALKESLHA